MMQDDDHQNSAELVIMNLHISLPSAALGMLFYRNTIHVNSSSSVLVHRFLPYAIFVARTAM